MSRTWELDVRGKRVSDFGLVSHMVMVVILPGVELLEEISDGKDKSISFGHANLVQFMIHPIKYIY